MNTDITVRLGWVPGHRLRAGLAVLWSPGQFRVLLVRVEMTINWGAPAAPASSSSSSRNDSQAAGR